MSVKRYRYEFKYETGPDMIKFIILEGINPFDALSTHRREDPNSNIWPSRIVSIVRVTEVN